MTRTRTITVLVALILAACDAEVGQLADLVDDARAPDTTDCGAALACMLDFCDYPHGESRDRLVGYTRGCADACMGASGGQVASNAQAEAMNAWAACSTGDEGCATKIASCDEGP